MDRSNTSLSLSLSGPVLLACSAGRRPSISKANLPPGPRAESRGSEVEGMRGSIRTLFPSSLFSYIFYIYYIILYHIILFLFYPFMLCSVLFCSVLFCSVLFCPIRTHSPDAAGLHLRQRPLLRCYPPPALAPRPPQPGPPPPARRGGEMAAPGPARAPVAAGGQRGAGARVRAAARGGAASNGYPGPGYAPPADVRGAFRAAPYSPAPPGGGEGRDPYRPAPAPDAGRPGKVMRGIGDDASQGCWMGFEATRAFRTSGDRCTALRRAVVSHSRPCLSFYPSLTRPVSC